MTQPAPFSPKREEAKLQGDPCFHLETKALASLERLALAWSISVTAALHRVLEAGVLHFEQGDAPESHLLSKKQQIVFQHLRAGLSVKEIAERLGVTDHTIRTHILRIRSHLKSSDLLSLRIQQDAN
jgi:DNA-binding NarL/FixJ family response regulator